ncbi:MAG TPA: hypothetical protein VJ798_02130 [Rhizomicrobium sp.]|nr:hypothetical protein [Rhizomicrobium sp.]
MGQLETIASHAVGTYSGLSDQELLNFVRAEMQRAVGFENDQELCSDRETALNYVKGVMPDVPSLDNRSRAVSTDVADAIESLMPDLMEIFTGGDDVAAFLPVKPEDEAAARQETDYLNHVIFQDNPGFLNLYSGFKDALLLKTGIWKFWWQKDLSSSDEEFAGKNIVEVQLAARDGEIIGLAPEKAPEEGDGERSFRFTLRRTADRSGARYMAVPPDDFAVAPDTIRLADATYCVMRSRPRAQELIAEGYDAEKVRALPALGAGDDNTIQRARDTAGEHEKAGEESDNDLRQVEIRDHYIRVLDSSSEGGDRLTLWRVTTDAEATVLLDKSRESLVPFAAGSPYLTAHRFYGVSLAEKLFEIQRIKTALTRAVLDGAYFALNQRYEVATGAGRAGDYTISDLLRNEPGMPVRSIDGNAVRPISAGGLNFDAYGALEYFSTVAEQRSGIVRNAQGLNPDTLHDTARGAMALINAAQKRVRLIARILAETCIKELYLGLHAVLRENASAERIVRLSGKWVPVDPSRWGSRNAMTIEVGLGASGREVEVAALRQIGDMMQMIVGGQGGAIGPIVTPQNVFNLATDTAIRLGRRRPERYFTDPGLSPLGAPLQAPSLAADNGEAAWRMASLEQKTAVAREKIASEAQLKREQMAAEFELRRYQIDRQAERKAAPVEMGGSSV